ncbi:hypothetical protein AAMO2058_001683800 [Amorphochlora amoebiformis]
MMGSLRRSVGMFAKRTFVKFKLPRFNKIEYSWKQRWCSIVKPNWRKFLLATSMVAPLYTEEDKIRDRNLGNPRDLARKMHRQSAGKDPSFHRPFRTSPTSQTILKFFGSRCVGLAQLGMFAAVHINPAAKRKPFKNLNDIFNLREDPVQKPTARSSHESKEGKIREPVDRAPLKLEGISYFDRKVTDNGVLVLKSEDIAPGRWEALSAYLKETPSVKTLRLQGVEITTKELKIIGASLKEIRHITFCDNSIGLNQGAFDVLCATLLCCGLLETTSIVRNSLTDCHVPQIVNLMTKHSSLKELSLCWNGIGDEGALQLAKALQDMGQAVTLSLRVLDLR